MRSTDTLTDNSIRMLDTLAHSPFVERDELAAFTELPTSSTLESLQRLKSQGLVAFVRHTRSNTSRVRRWYLTPRGVKRLVAVRGSTPSRLLRELPVSVQWQRSLLRRLDAVASLYRVGREVAGCSDCTIEWRWLRTGALDALLELPDGGALCLVRFGPTLSWQAMRSRIGTLYGMQRTGHCPTALLLLPGNIETQRLAADLRGRRLRLFAAVEHDAIRAAPGSAIWRSLRDTRGLTLSQVIGRGRDTGSVRLRAAAGSGRQTMPVTTLNGGADGLDLVATMLTMPERRLLDALYDWPLATAAHLGALLGMTEGMMMKTRASLVKRDLVCQLRIGGTPEQRRRNGTRLCLSSDGLRYLARRDRRRVSDLLGLWNIVSDEEGDERLDVNGYRLNGTKLWALARELRHTDGVSDFVAGLAAACRRSTDWRLLQALPPHRWERWFRYNEGWRSIRPDATIELEHRGSRLSYLLEYERRAIKPGTMAEKLMKYRRYFQAADARVDFDGRQATALFVFADEATASRFCALAAGSLRRPLSLLVSSMETVAETGPLRRVWRSPWQLERGRVSLAAAF